MSKWTELTWNDLKEWADATTVERGRAYQRQGRVKDLCIGDDGAVLADVMGGDRYVTKVWWERVGKRNEELASQCTCPVGWRCKHAVALVAEYLEMIAAGKEPGKTNDDDPRWQDLEDAGEQDWEEDEFDDQGEDDEETRPRVKRKPSGRNGRRITDEQVREEIRQKGHAELVELVMDYLERFPELKKEWRDRMAMARGDVGELLREARRELREITREPAWRNSWTGEGYLPDYGRLIKLLERLNAMGHADEVAAFGREVVEQGFAQAGNAGDEGEALDEVGRCVGVVLDAVAKSSLSGAQKILYAIDVAMADDWAVTDEALGAVLDKSYAKEQWSEVADTLLRRLKEQPKAKGDDFSSKYQRDKLSRWIGQALEEAGRRDELLTLYEREARATQSYERLVEHLLRHHKTDEAMQWATEGIAATRDKAPGIAMGLATTMHDMAARRDQWDIVTAYEWQQFEAKPSAEQYHKVIEAAGKAGCRDAVEKWAMRLLEKGESPVRVVHAEKPDEKLEIAKDWPLPMPEFLRPLYGHSRYGQSAGRPQIGVLIDLAIEQNNPAEVLRRYDQLRAAKPRDPWDYRWQGYGDRVAAAVVKSHPERALEIHRERLEGMLGAASKQAYEAVGHRLRLMRPVFGVLNRAKEWDALMASIRERYRNRPRLMDVLDTLTGRPIVQTTRKRRR